jgi:hypothetical protein
MSHHGKTCSTLPEIGQETSVWADGDALSVSL